MKPIFLILLLSAPAFAQQQNFQIDPLEFSDCLPRWNRNLHNVHKSQLPKIRHQLLQLIKYEKAKTERAKLLHRLGTNYFRQYEAGNDKKYLVEAIKILQKLIQSHPVYNKLDEVYLLMGEALWTAGRDKQALKVFKMFIKNHPRSKDIPRGYIFFGEFFFKQQHHEKARRMFLKAESLGSTEYSYCASHRIAYCHYKLGDTQQAIEWLNKANDLRSSSR